MAEQHAYSAARRVTRNFVFFVMTATFASGCYFDVSTSLDNASGTRTAEQLAGTMVWQFAQQADGATADIVCPAGLSGHAGEQLTCTGTTSDGYALTIVVVEREEGAFRWDIVDSVPVT